MSELAIERHWLLTSTTYGTWLPGSPALIVKRAHREHFRPDVLFR
jgi:hypothetical protein